MLLKPIILVVISSLALGVGSPIFARPVPMQTYQELADKADVIVIADASAPKEVEHTGGLSADAYQQVETTLRVHLVLKGELADKETVTLVHFRVKSDTAREVLGGPRLLEFNTEGKFWQFTFDLGRGNAGRTMKAKYLLFLKRKADGRYEPVTGQSEAAESAKLLASPEM